MKTAGPILPTYSRKAEKVAGIFKQASLALNEKA
jgi:hypothetical protein